jgi:hypothetical protein
MRRPAFALCRQRKPSRHYLAAAPHALHLSHTRLEALLQLAVRARQRLRLRAALSQLLAGLQALLASARGVRQGLWRGGGSA